MILLLPPTESPITELGLVPDSKSNHRDKIAHPLSLLRRKLYQRNLSALAATDGFRGLGSESLVEPPGSRQADGCSEPHFCFSASAMLKKMLVYDGTHPLEFFVEPTPETFT